MKDEAISSSGDPFPLFPLKSSSPPPTPTPAASSAGASSPALATNAGSTDWQEQGQSNKGGSLSRIGSHPTRASLSTSAGGSALGSSHSSCRPWERGDLLRRLSTFIPENWFGKPKAASSLACARRGWINVNVDKVECESCGTNLQFTLSAAMTLSKADSAGEDFLKKLDEGHKLSCPWRGNSCAESLVQFPPTPPSALIGGFKDRCDGLIQFPFLPVVAVSAIGQMRVSRGPEIDHLLAETLVFGGGESGFKCDLISGNGSIQEDVISSYSRAQKLISLCGWEPRWLPNIQDCEEHSAQSARNGYSVGQLKNHGLPRDQAHGKKALSSSTRKELVKKDVLDTSSKGESRSALLDCGLCGATVRIWDFLTVARPSCFGPNIIDIPETSKKMMLTRGVSAASGISGWFTPESLQQIENREEDATTDEGKSLSNVGLDLNLSMAGGLPSSHIGMKMTSEEHHNVHRARDPTGQLSSSDLGGRAESYESRGPSTRKRHIEEGGSTFEPPMVMQPTDSVEGTVIDHDGDEVDDGKQYLAGPSKRTRGFDIFDAYHSPNPRDPFGAGPSQPFGFEIGADAPRDDPFEPGQERVLGFPSTRDSTRASSVIAMDTVCQSADDDSMESVENYPLEVDDAHFPSTSTFRNADLNETSELNYSNQAQQSTCPGAVGGAGEMGVSSTNEEEVLNADNATVHGRDGPSFGISGGSVGMGASHEAEIHGTYASVHRSDSFVGDVEPVPEITENQGLTSDFAPDPGLMGDFVPEEVDREDPHGDNQDLISGSVGRADSGSKIIGSAKAESFESGEKSSKIRFIHNDNSAHLSLSCNAVLCSGFDASKDEVNQAGKELPTDDGGYVESHFLVANALGPPNGESNYGEALEFDPIKNHNPFCPWVNGNVAAAGGSSSSGSTSSAGALALCGWQLTLDALDAFHELGHIPNQNAESESAASLNKDDHRATGRKLLARHSFSKTHGQC